MGLVLQYRINGTADLKDLQKVFICATGKDLKQYFEVLSEDLFKAQSNISVWYPVEDPETPGNEDSYMSLLADMDLFVIPVTAAFLDEESRARTVEMPYAMEHGIPVLPILFGKVPKSRFSEVCGKLHVLDKYDADPTALPYEDKLKLFIGTVLLKDEMIEKIRQAFAAYIFLSYRKKDRKYAQEVMRLIHRSPFARDIAIWYDEYLTPGEDFNESIRKAFNKSDIFALVVTPNLLERSNYVMRIEYPMAYENGKKIIPVMPVLTDGAELEQCYPGIPEVISTEGTGADNIDQLIREALTIKQDDSPEHKFIMGLAYLSGIDVETDHERALELITDAAEADLDEALLKLVSMYENGQGVKRSYYYGAVWHEKYIGLLKRRFEGGDAGEDAGALLIREMNTGIQKWHNIFRDDKAWGLCVTMNSLKSVKMTVQEETAFLENYILMAQISLNKTPPDHIIEPFTRAAGESLDSICSKLTSCGEEAKSEEFRRFYRTGLRLLGAQALRARKDWSAAVKEYKDTAKDFEECFSLGDKELVKRSEYSLVICCGELADCMYHANGDSCRESPEALEYAQKAISLAKTYEEKGISFTEKDTAVPLFIIVRALTEKNECDEAEKMLGDFIALCEKRKEEEESVDSLRMLSQAHVLFAAVKNLKGDLSGEEKHLLADTELLHKLSGIIGNHNVYLQEINDYKRLIELAVKQGKESKEYLKRLFGIGIWHYRNDRDYFMSLATLARECDDYPMFQQITKQLIEIEKNRRNS